MFCALALIFCRTVLGGRASAKDVTAANSSAPLRRGSHWRARRDMAQRARRRAWRSGKRAWTETGGAAARAGATQAGAGAYAGAHRITITARRIHQAAERIGGRGDARSAVGRAELRSGNRRAGGRRIQSKGARTLAGYA